MTPQIATYSFVAVIIGLFWLTRDPEARVSKALCLPLVWLWLTSSRSVTEWVAIAQTGRPLASSLLSSATRSADRSNSYIEGTPLDRTVLIVLMTLALIVLIKRKRLGVLMGMNLPIVLFLLYAALTALWSDFPDVTIRRWFKAAGCLLMVMVVLSERDRDAAMRRLFVWAGFLLIPHSILLIKYYPAIGRAYNRWTWIVSYVGVTTHKNSLGGICQVYGVTFVWHFITAYRDRLRADRMRHLIAYGAAIAMVLYLFWLANSVTAQSVFLLATALLVGAQMGVVVRKPWLVHMVMLLLVAVPFAALFLGVGGSALEGMGRDSTLTGRTDIWARVMSLVDNPILGTGFESFWLGRRLAAMDRYQLGLNEAHNGYIEIYISLGWIGVVLLTIM